MKFKSVSGSRKIWILNITSQDDKFLLKSRQVLVPFKGNFVKGQIRKGTFFPKEIILSSDSTLKELKSFVNTLNI